MELHFRGLLILANTFLGQKFALFWPKKKFPKNCPFLVKKTFTKKLPFFGQKNPLFGQKITLFLPKNFHQFFYSKFAFFCVLNHFKCVFIGRTFFPPKNSVFFVRYFWGPLNKIFLLLLVIKIYFLGLLSQFYVILRPQTKLH